MTNKAKLATWLLAYQDQEKPLSSAVVKLAPEIEPRFECFLIEFNFCSLKFCSNGLHWSEIQVLLIVHSHNIPFEFDNPKHLEYYTNNHAQAVKQEILNFVPYLETCPIPFNIHFKL